MEWKKILVNRKLLSVMIVLFLLQMIVFWEDYQKNDRIWMERRDQLYEDYLREEEEQHIDSYHASMQAIMDQADEMSGISIASCLRDVFTLLNIANTATPIATMERIIEIISYNVMIIFFILFIPRQTFPIIKEESTPLRQPQPPPRILRL